MEELRKLTTRQLQTLLKERGLPYRYYVKEDLIERLSKALSVDELNACGGEELGRENLPESSEESNSESDNKAVGGLRGKSTTDKLTEGEEEKTIDMPDDKDKVCNFVFRDVEESLELFNGESSRSVTVWLKNFEDIAGVCEWNDVQRYLYARRLLRGAARLSVESVTEVSNWKALKSHLTKEFGDRVTSISIHRTLESRKKGSNETYLEYMYSMRQIANRGSIDEESLLLYIVSGIQDEVMNKSVLYEATTFDELKQKFRVYEAMKNQRSVKKPAKFEQKPIQNKERGGPSNSRCANCGGLSHGNFNCPHRSKGSRCFNCGEFGHIASNCDKPRKAKSSQENNHVNTISPDLHVEVSLNKKKYLALIDTGSDVTLIRESVRKHWRIREDEKGPSISLTGFGQQIKKTLGSCIVTLFIDSDHYRVRCHVVPDSWLSRDVLIGKDMLKKATLLVENGKVTIKKVNSPNIEENGDNFLEKMDVVQLIEKCDTDRVEEIINPKLREKVKSLITEYKPVRPERSCIEMTICVEDEIPVYQKPRRLAPREKEVVRQQIQEWLAEGIVKPSGSSFASPIVLATKRDGSARLCVDYRQLNTKIIKDRYPLPLIEEVLENLYDARIFTTLDLRNGFFHVDVKKECQKYTAFVTPDGQYEFTKAPFGLCNSPAVFQRYINTIFRPLIKRNVLLVYMDDIIIPSVDEEENYQKLQQTLQVAKENGLIFKWTKCKFLKRSIDFLGHIVEAGSVRPSEEKIMAVKGFQVPKTVKQVQSFLGLTGFFRKFIPQYSVIAKPLTDLTRKSSTYNFGSPEIDAFNLLKDRLCRDPVLKLFNPRLETELHTDASKFGYGGVLLQRHGDDSKLHPVFYISFKTTDAEKNYSSYELEVLAIIKSLKKLRTYLLGLSFKIITDCKAFQLTMRKKELSSRVARWALLLEEYDCTIQHRSGSAMRHVDALSRYPAVFSVESSVLQQVRRAQARDETCRLVATLLQEREFVLRNDVLYKFVDGNFLLVVPKSLQKEIIRNVHDQGHINRRKVEILVKQEYFISNLSKKVEAVLSNCVQCILASRKQGKPEGLLNPIEKIDLPLHTYHADHLGPLPSTSKNYKYLFVIIDAFTKFCWIYPVKAVTTDEVIKKLDLQAEVFGNPHRIITDRGTAFTSGNFRVYCEEQKVQHILVTTGVPRGNGQVERLNQTIIAVLTKMSLENPERWFKHVPHLQRILNSTASRATGKTPFELLFGVKMTRREDFRLSRILEEELVREFDDNRQELRQQAKRDIEKIQEENRRYARRKRKVARNYSVGDLVAIKRTQFAPGAKLYPKFMGPYQVSKRKGKDRYDLVKVGDHEGPNFTNSAADHMKPWSQDESEDSSEADEQQDGRLWELQSTHSTQNISNNRGIP